MDRQKNPKSRKPVAFTEKRVHTRTSAFEHGLNMVEQCISMYVHENMKMPQES